MKGSRPWFPVAVATAIAGSALTMAMPSSGSVASADGVNERVLAIELRFEAIRAHRTYRHWTAFDEAAAVAQARSAPDGPLIGSLIAVKDNIDLSWLPTSAGALALRDRRPTRNATVIDRLLRAGAAVAGHTNMDTWARGVRSVSETTGATANARSPSLGPMGSSGGSAAVSRLTLLCVVWLSSDD